jgi:signal transduction histidine kinase
MLIWAALFASVVVTITGTLLFWSNPRRPVNRVVFTCSLHLAGWLAFLHLAFTKHPGLFWVRCACAISAWIPMHFWVVKENIARDARSSLAKWFLRGWGWITVSVFLSVICFTDVFIRTYSTYIVVTDVSAPAPHTGIYHSYGWGYYLYIIGVFGLYGLVLFRSFKEIQVLKGGRRLEMQVWVNGGCAMTLAIITTMALNALTKDYIYTRLQPLLVLAFYGGTAYAITTSRIFDAHQILRVCLNKLILASAVIGVAYAVFISLLQFFPPIPALLPTIAIALACSAIFKGWLDRRFEFYPQDTAARQAAYTVAQNETRVENLEAAYLDILRGWGQTDQAIIITGASGNDPGAMDDLTEEDFIARVLRQLRWATPERLARERTNSDSELLTRYMTEHRLGALVFSETPMLNVIVGVGVPASRRAFTYPQITQLLELAAIIEGAFERTLMAIKIQHSEQLATVGLLGASLAHEIRNPLVSVKAIVQLLPTRYQEVEFREKFFRLIGDEVTRIDRLTEQLLDLASPRVYKAQMIDLHPVLKSGLDLVAPRASDKRVRLISEFQASPDKAYTDPAAVTQVLLNLCFNAIQALEIRSEDRWVKVLTRNTTAGIELVVSDNGPGLTSEMRKRLFRPFQTTKSSGFGLGLTICRDILAGLKVPIVLDPPVEGQGATFRVIFPCQP